MGFGRSSKATVLNGHCFSRVIRQKRTIKIIAQLQLLDRIVDAREREALWGTKPTPIDANLLAYDRETGASRP
jgi:hypothetical protein